MRDVVKKSPPVTVRPSSERPRVTEKLSPFDKPYVNAQATSFLVFKRPIHDAAGTIKRALSQALVYYYPFAGRISSADDGELHVHCHGEGVTFVAASADCSLKDANVFDISSEERTLLDELAVYCPQEGCGPTDPLLLMQVIEICKWVKPLVPQLYSQNY